MTEKLHKKGVQRSMGKLAEQFNCSDKFPINRELCEKKIEGSSLAIAESEAITGTSKLLTAEWTWRCSDASVVETAQRDFRSETLLVDTKHVLEDEIHVVMSEHLIV